MSRVDVTWLGQAGFIFERRRADGESLRLMIDPFLSDHELRTYSPPSVDHWGHDIDYVLVTHEHFDHLDIGTISHVARMNPSVRLILPAPLIDHVAGVVGDDALIAVSPRDVVKLDDDVEVEVVPAYHGVEVADAYWDGCEESGSRFVGYLLSFGSVTVYHSGDTIVVDDLCRALDGKAIDVAVLPINGRDFFRERAGLVGNMDAREAVQLAQHLGVRALIPMHWDAFSGNTESPGRAADEAATRGAAFHVIVLARCVPTGLERVVPVND